MRKIIDILNENKENNTPIYSFEIFPPRTEQGILHESLRIHLRSLSIFFVVTRHDLYLQSDQEDLWRMPYVNQNLSFKIDFFLLIIFSID